MLPDEIELTHGRAIEDSCADLEWHSRLYPPDP